MADEEKKEEIKKGEEKEVKETKASEENSPDVASAEETSRETKDNLLDNLSKEALKIIDGIEKMTVLELNALVRALEKKFGVSAQAVAVAASSGTGEGDDEEKDSFTVELTAVGEQKIQVIKAVKELLGLGLKEAKDIIDGVPSMLKEGVKKDEAEEIKKKIEAAGGKAELKQRLKC